jgi:uncharacterized protein (DUF2345 family)
MTIDQIKRLYYYQRQYLGAKDFETEQVYHRDMRRRHNLAHHTWGIVTGLDLVEVQQEGQATGVDVYVLPGMAVDGYGREIFVLEPYKLDTNPFGSFTDAGYLELYIGYNEEETKRPAAGYELCDVEKQYTRIRETFCIVVEPESSTDDGLDVAGREVDPSTGTFKGQSKPELTIPPDGSVPYQDLPEEKDKPRWLVRLGSVYWGGSNNPGFTSAGAAYLSEGREYVGNVTSAVLAPDAKLRLSDRATESPLASTDAGVAVAVEGSLGVDRILTAKSDMYVKGKVGVGTTNPDVNLHVVGGKDASVANGSGYVVIGPVGGMNIVIDDNEIMARDTGATSPLHLQADGGDLLIHGNKAGTNFAVKDSGNVGIGTSVPGAKLHIAGGTDAELASGGFLVIGSATGANLALDDNEIMARSNGGKSPLYLQANGGDLLIHSKEAGTNVAIKDSGNVGIGTLVPGAKLHIVGGTDVELTSGGVLVIGSVTGANLALDGNEIMARNNGGESPLHLQADGGDLFIHSNQSGTNVTVKDSGNVGVGTLAPGAKLHIVGGTDAELTSGGFLVIGSVIGTNLALDDNEIMARNNGGKAPLLLQTDGGDLLIHNDDAASRVVVKDSGNVGIGEDNPSYPLDVNGWIRADGVTYFSDARWKKDVKPLQGVLEKVIRLRGVEFEWKTDDVEGRRFEPGKQIGVVAQEVEKVFPELVMTAPDGTKSVAYMNVIPVLIEAIKELKAENDALERRVGALEKAIGKQKKS